MLRSVLIVILVSITAGRPAAAGPFAPGDDPHVYRPPLDAPVSDPFRLPDQPWLSGNRGLQYASVPGSAVRAIGPGVVVFAGPVAGSLYVTVLHPDGLRSSYSYLAAIRVTVGARVVGGDVVGVAAAAFHLGVRDGDQYIDPAGLFGRPVTGGSVFLVPLDGGPSPPPASPGAPGLTPARSAISFGPAVAHLGERLSGAVGEATRRAVPGPDRAVLQRSPRP